MHLWDIPIDRLQYIRLSAWLIELFFLLGNACTKISILLVYRKISARSHITWFIRLTWAAIALTVAYTVGLGLELVFVCRPLVSYWKSYSPDYTGKYTCDNEQIPIVFSAAASVFSDIYASILPMMLVKNLNMTSRQRLSLYALFSAGLLTAGIGVARLVFLVKVTTNYQLGTNTHDVTWYGWPTFVRYIRRLLKKMLKTFQALTDIEAHLAIICASLPALKVLFQRQMFSKISNSHPSAHSNITRGTLSPSSPSSIPHTANTITPRPASIFTKWSYAAGRPQREISFMKDYAYADGNLSLQSVASNQPLKRIVAPQSGPQKYNCQCALCASIDAYENRLIADA
jgi:hypothetical protein